jgi:glycosyltransferase involved in cell wall biosynthesis
MSGHYKVTAVISTYNRCEMLTTALASVLRQQDQGIRYEVIVVDNNSSDATRQVVENCISQGNPDLRYVFEPRQGSSHARNAGIEAARSDIIAFADDDVRVDPNWIANIKRAFDEHPEVDCVGGKVLPLWNTPPPRWLTRAQWMPLALQDYGNRALSINRNNRLCLVSANLAVRRRAFREAGMFAPELQRIKDGIGSMEDAELIERFWETGVECLYVPDLIVKTDVAAERITKTYHRLWHRGHGYFYAIKRSEEIERGSRRLFDVPAHLYRQAIADAAAWLLLLAVDRSRAFGYEARVNFFWGFARKRREDYIATTYRGLIREFLNLVRSSSRNIPAVKARTSAMEQGEPMVTEESSVRH